MAMIEPCLSFKEDAYCGLYCGACELLVATREGTLDALAEQRDMPPEDLTCYGCKTARSSIYCQTCAIKQCARARQVEFCVECADYPCERLRAFQGDGKPHKAVLQKNLAAINAQGVDAWLAAQQRRWNCPACGVRFAYYARSCRNGHAPVYNCEDEARDEQARGSR